MTQVYQVGEGRLSPRLTLRSESLTLMGNKLPEWAEEFSEFLFLIGQQHADVRIKCTLINRSRKKKFL